MSQFCCVEVGLLGWHLRTEGSANESHCLSCPPKYFAFTFFLNRNRSNCQRHSSKLARAGNFFPCTGFLENSTCLPKSQSHKILTVYTVGETCLVPSCASCSSAAYLFIGQSSKSFTFGYFAGLLSKVYYWSSRLCSTDSLCGQKI